MPDLPDSSASQSQSPPPQSPKSPTSLHPPQSPKSPTSLHPPQPPKSPTTSKPLSPKSSTHINNVQPHASFFRVSRPTENRPQRPTSASSAVQNRIIDAIHLAPLSRQLSTTSLSDGSSIAARRAGKQSREPLLPIGRSPRPNTANTVTSEPSFPTTNTGGMRGSLEKIFKRGMSSDSPPKSPSHANMRKSPLQHEAPRSAPPVNDGFFAGQSPQQSAPSGRSPATLRQSATFVPRPPPSYTPFVTVISSKTGQPQRNYEDYPSQNIFFFRGHLLTSRDSILPFLFSLTLVFGISGTWFATTCVWWWHSESPSVALVGGYMFLLTISSMLATALRDPGILPRNLDPDPPYPTVSSTDDTPLQPFPRDLRIGEGVVRVKYCITCKTYRPPRSSHCKTCDNCIDACDHHCHWLNNCVGRRNYTSFISFLVAASLTLVLSTVTAGLHLSILTRRDHTSFRKALEIAPGSAVVFALGIVVIWPLFALMGYHVRLLLLNITTIEQVRNKAHVTVMHGSAPPNPFSLGRWYRNVAYLLCRPAGYTWIDASGLKMEDRRELNPGAYDEYESDGEV